MGAPVAGLMAWLPVKTPVFSLVTFRVTRSCRFVRSRYASTSARCSSVVRLATSGCSGANTRYVAPKIVSGLVVKTAIRDPGLGTTEGLGTGDWGLGETAEPSGCSTELPGGSSLLTLVPSPQSP